MSYWRGAPPTRAFGDAENPDLEAEAYAVETAQGIFGTGVKTLRDLGTLIKEVGKRVNTALRKAQAGQAMLSESENAYFAGDNGMNQL